MIETIEAVGRSCRMARLGEPEKLGAPAHLLAEKADGTPIRRRLGLA